MSSGGEGIVQSLGRLFSSSKQTLDAILQRRAERRKIKQRRKRRLRDERRRREAEAELQKLRQERRRLLLEEGNGDDDGDSVGGIRDALGQGLGRSVERYRSPAASSDIFSSGLRHQGGSAGKSLGGAKRNEGFIEALQSINSRSHQTLQGDNDEGSGSSSDGGGGGFKSESASASASQGRRLKSQRTVAQVQIPSTRIRLDQKDRSGLGRGSDRVSNKNSSRNAIFQAFTYGRSPASGTSNRLTQTRDSPFESQAGRVDSSSRNRKHANIIWSHCRQNIPTWTFPTMLRTRKELC
jgi:hypothetical protein